jgi:hypothetical protein
MSRCDQPVTNLAVRPGPAKRRQHADLHRSRDHGAVAVGFEPTEELPPHTLSRRAP